MNNNKQYYVQVLPLVFLLLSIAEMASARVLQSPAQNSQAILGKGYDTNKESFAGDCVTGEIIYAGAQDSSINFERSLNAEELSDSLGFSVGGSTRYGVIHASAAAKFSSESSSNEYSESTIYMAEYKFKNAKLAYANLTEIGKKALGTDFGTSNFTWENWEKTCGHEFVEQIQLGAKIFISAKVEFATKEDKSAFAADFKIKGPAFSASAELKKASRRFGKRASVTIRAYQLGGDVSRLSAIFGRNPNNRISGNDQSLHALLACSMDRIDACIKILDSAISYASDLSDPESFPNQIKTSSPLNSPNGPAQLAYLLSPWEQLALYSPPAILKSTVLEAKKEFANFFEENLKYRNRILGLLNSPIRLSFNQDHRIKDARERTNRNLRLIVDGATICYAAPERCVSEIISISQRIEPIDELNMEVYPESFAQWCDGLSTQLISFSARKTIQKMMQIAAADNNLDAYSDACKTAEQILSEMKEIDLSNQGISNIEPLLSLINVETLDMRNNTLTNIEGIEKLTQLKTLRLQNNQLKEIAPLLSVKGLGALYLDFNLLTTLPSLNTLENLNILWLGNNQLESLTGISSLPKLEYLRLNNNMISNISPLITLPRLKSLIISNNYISNFSPLINIPKLEYVELNDNPSPCPRELENICALEM
ncbi:MAG: leucine-rich repeat domain-containing protein [Oligoflexia bacterium]|nr:leucine-rich repeat domain-containing protein [Oligoflexia bacterium]